MAANLVFPLYQGEVGETIEFTVEDRDGTVDLTPYTVTMTLTRNGVTTIDAVSVTKANQTTNRGECSYTFDATTAAIAVGNHKGRLKLVQGSNVLYWPKNVEGRLGFFTVKVSEP